MRRCPRPGNADGLEGRVKLVMRGTTLSTATKLRLKAGGCPSKSHEF